MSDGATVAPHPILAMCVLNLLVLLLVATRPARSVATEPGHGWDERLDSGQVNVAARIASSTTSDTMSSSQKWARVHTRTKGNSLLAFEFSNINRVDQFGECSSMNERDSSPGSNIDASHISIDSQHLNQEGENPECLIDLNRIPIDSEILPSKDSLENFVPDNRHDHQFVESSPMNEWDSGPGSKFDASHISIHSQQLIQKRKNLDCLIDLNRIPIDWEILPSKDFFENLVPDSRNDHQFGDSSSRNFADCHRNTSSNRDASRISIDCQQSIQSVEGKTFDCRIGNTINSKNKRGDVHENSLPDKFPQQTRKMVRFGNFKYLMGLRLICPLLNWDLDEVKDYDSLCVFLGKETNPEQVEFHDSGAMTEHIVKLLSRGKSGRDNVEVGQSNIDVLDPGLIAKAPSTLQKLILISNFVLKLVSCRTSGCSISPNGITCFKSTCIPVLQCLAKCCGKDIDLFQTRWGTHFKHQNFGAKCCPGRGSNHNTCGYHRTKIVRNSDYRDKNSGLLDLQALVVAASTSSTAEEKLKLCYEFHEKYRSTGSMAQKLLRSFYRHSSQPIWGCFVHHCGQGINEWIRKWGPQFTHGNFDTRKCHGLQFLQCGSVEPPFDIPARHDLRYKSTRDLLPALSEIFKQYEQFVISKPRSMRSPHPDLTSLIRKCLRPINNCLQRHCAGSVDEFVRRWGKSIFYTRFYRNCCPGTGRKESDICPYNSRSSQC